MNTPTQEVVCPKCGKPITLPQKSYCAACGARIFRSTNGESTVDPYLGQVIDNTFEVQSVLGTGSMGIVYKARHRALDCHVALKILKHDLLSDRVVQARFQREAQAASKLSHPNVIRILHFGKTALQAPYIAMECLDGMELGVLLPKEYPLDQRRVCSIALQTARALSAAHAANIVHRDLKPANIFVIQRSGVEQVKVLDFGIAKVSDIEGEGLTREGAMCGTPAFMSPEQVIGKQVTYASDLFSLGSVMYYMLTNRLPFQGENMVDMARAILTANPVSPCKARLDHYIDPRLDAICMKALEKDVSKRYQSALEMVADLEKAYSEIPANATMPKPKLVVLGDGSKVDPTGATQCMLPAYPEEEEDPALNGGTIVEIPAMKYDDSEVMDTAKSGIVGALDAFGQAVSEVLGKQPEEHKLAPEDKTIINAKSMSDGEIEDPEEAREILLEHRKRLMLGMVCFISIVCVLVIVIMALISSMRKKASEEEFPAEEIAAVSDSSEEAPSRTDTSEESSDTPTDTSKETADNSALGRPQEEAKPEYDAAQIAKLSEKGKSYSQTGLITGIAMGLGYHTAEEESEPSPADDNDMPKDADEDAPSNQDSLAQGDEQASDVKAVPPSPKESSETQHAEAPKAPSKEASPSPKADIPAQPAPPKPKANSTAQASAPKPKAVAPSPNKAETTKASKPANAASSPTPKSASPSSSKGSTFIVDYDDVVPQPPPKKEEPEKPKTSAISKKIAEAQKYDKEGNHKRACTIYKALSGKTTGIEPEEKELIQKRLKSCNRIQI